MYARPNTLWNTSSLNGPYKRNFLSLNDIRELFQNIEIKNMMSFLEAINIYGKTLKKFEQD